MVTWMQHQKHGKHPATGDEIDRLKAAGWTLCPPKVATVQPVEIVQENQESPVLDSPQETQKRSPGRPPKNAGIGYGFRTKPD